MTKRSVVFANSTLQEIVAIHFRLALAALFTVWGTVAHDGIHTRGVYPLSEYDGKMKTKNWKKSPHFPKPGGEGGGETKWVEPEKFFDQLPVIMKEIPPLPGEESLYAMFQSVLDAAAKDPKIKETLTKTAVAAEKEIITPLLQFHNNGRPVGNGWDQGSLKEVRDALNALAAANGGIDSARMFGSKEEVDPVQHLLGTAAGWGGNPASAAIYAGVSPDKNDGETVYRVTVKDVPVDGFWSISVYNKDGFFEKNPQNAYTLNNVTAKPNSDGSVTIQFGGEGTNVLPITSGWNYLVRLYRPHKEVLDGTWKFPVAVPVN